MTFLRTIITSGALVLALAATTPVQAQGRLQRPRQAGGAARLSQLENAKIAFLTARLSLSQDQAQRFWPVYNEFIGKRRELGRSARQLRRDAANAGLSDAQLRDNFTQDFAVRQQQLNLEKEYFDKLQKPLTLRQVAQLYQAERDFTKEVLRRVAGGPPAAAPQPDAD